MSDVKITGTEVFVRTAKALNAAGSGGLGLKRELRKAIERAADPMVDEVREHVAQYLPDRYAAVMARDLKVRQSWSTRGSSIGLKLIGSAKGVSRKRHIRVINQGTLRHKVYGNPEVWVDQRVRPGFWNEPLSNARDKPAREIRRAVEETARKIRRAI